MPAQEHDSKPGTVSLASIRFASASDAGRCLRRPQPQIAVPALTSTVFPDLLLKYTACPMQNSSVSSFLMAGEENKMFSIEAASTNGLAVVLSDSPAAATGSGCGASAVGD